MKKQLNRSSFFVFLFVSFSVHVFLLLWIFFSNHFWNKFQTDKKIQIPNAIRVDMVSLPEIRLQSQTVKSENRKSDIVSKKPKLKEKKKPLKKTKINKQIKKTKINKQIKKTKANKQKNKSPKKTQRKKTPVKGNKMALGNSTEQQRADLQSQTMSAIQTYLEDITEGVKTNWNLPKYLADKDLETQVEIRIDDKGVIFYKQIFTSSGNALFDSWVLKAIENKATDPPSKLIREQMKEGIIFTLRSRD